MQNPVKRDIIYDLPKIIELVFREYGAVWESGPRRSKDDTSGKVVQADENEHDKEHENAGRS